MNILITGITGLFGNQLAREFSQIGNIHGLRRNESQLGLLSDFDFPVHWHQGELSDFESLLDAMQGIDLVVHAAGMVSFLSKDKDLLYEVNTRGTANVVDAMLSVGVKKLVHVSSVAAIGRNPEKRKLDEKSKWIESNLNTEYAVSKYWAELEAWRGEQEGLELIVVNPSVLLGKVSYGKSSTSIYSYVLDENRFFPKGSLNYIDVRDAARITRLLVEKSTWGDRFVLNRESLPFREFFSEIAAVFGKRAPSIPLSSWQISLFSTLVSIAKLFGFKNVPLNRRSAMLSQQNISFDNSKIQSLLDYQFYSLRESLEWAKSS
ncbi:NAD-dependent epimerase/dehydratase family protein [Algoriphagus aestuariicola]|uniref:NAD-dependent epimerase/dehydratase family protein n=1 Tax=Algoriphagus aestuariicola TaxID=1852016 RepID=A0ABS3BVA7_9BACT|nr:NAD-dependent epimerase/dehydratase family protein [Algoriphagus aestuariicola]MBN7802275.1 NAD-dependent epimerase/dehydratase family protein [Algoriphagus aestuariicola]